jgi:hypothetical protein
VGSHQDARKLFARDAVDAFAEEIRVTIVAHVLLDHVARRFTPTDMGSSGSTCPTGRR